MRVACIQLCSGNNVEENRLRLLELIRRAARAGAEFVCTPEMSNVIERSKKRLLDIASFEQDDATLQSCRELARALGIDLLIGSLAIKVNSDKCANRSYLINRDGGIAAYYDKINLFDVQLATGESHAESSCYQAGNRQVTAAIGNFTLGMSICYDLRFPNHFRQLLAGGADILLVPSAFTHSTGEAHWQTLLRARAIENAAYVLAPNQAGQHHDGSQSYGNSLIIDPWGRIMANAGSSADCVIQATVNTEQLFRIRNQIPSWRSNVTLNPAE